MDDRTIAWIVAAVCTANVAVLVAALATLRDDGMGKPGVRPRRCDRPFGPATALGVIMSALDDALARFTAFVKDVVGQLTATKDTNAEQTGKIAELQAALDAALSDDAADKAAIQALQAEIATLQDEVAAKIDATLDALANPPVVDVPADEPVLLDEAPVVEEAPVDGPVVPGPAPLPPADEPLVEVSDDLVVVEADSAEGEPTS